MWGIVGHLSNYNQPNVQVYVVRILWMVPLYSFESWLAMRFHKQAIYIETLRDFYESYVLYSFLQFLIEVLGGEENLIEMLKDKSPTRGVHMWGLQFCTRPWLMGQPLRRTNPNNTSPGSVKNILPFVASGREYDIMSTEDSSDDGNLSQTQASNVVSPSADTPTSTGSGIKTTRMSKSRTRGKGKSFEKRRHSKPTVIWTSPFFLNCKFGVLQYVLLKLFSAVAVLLLEWKGWYREGRFDWQSGYLYICLLTNTSQCWALYSLIFFYYATKTELSPIRPVGKFLSVKALVFFTWWQSVFISVLYQMDMIPTYRKDWTSEDVAKGIQDYLICVEMFAAAVVHAFVFPHTEYSQAAVEARLRAVISAGSASYYANARSGRKRLGRHKIHGQHYYTKFWKDNYLDDGDGASKNSNSHLDLCTAVEEGTACGGKVDPPVHQEINRYNSKIEMSSSWDRPNNRSRIYNESETKQPAVAGDMHEVKDNHISPHRINTNPESQEIFFPSQAIPALKECGGKELTRSIIESDISKTKTIREFGKRNSDFVRNTETYGSEGNYLSDNHQCDDDDDDDSGRFNAQRASALSTARPGFVRALLDSAIPRDLGQNTVAIVTGEYHVAKKTLLHHATTSDQYDLFSNRRRIVKQQPRQESDNHAVKKQPQNPN
jgi:Organic solute transporter Ostalpha